MTELSVTSERVISIRKYDHRRWEPRRRRLRFLLRTIAFPWLAKVDRVEGLENLPTEGAAILLINHIAFIDPVVVLHVVPRNIVPMAKIEVYAYPLVGIFPRLWGVIPVRRGEVDRRAVQRALQVLEAGEIVLVAPEGTRSPQLRQAKTGVAYLASRSGAPVVPVAVENTIGFPAFPFSRRWWGAGAEIHFGRPFRYRASLERSGHDDLHRMTDEAMYILAAMLPPQRRGVYANLSKATQETIEWL